MSWKIGSVVAIFGFLPLAAGVFSAGCCGFCSSSSIKAGFFRGRQRSVMQAALKGITSTAAFWRALFVFFVNGLGVANAN